MIVYWRYKISKQNVYILFKINYLLLVKFDKISSMQNECPIINCEKVPPRWVVLTQDPKMGMCPLAQGRCSGKEKRNRDILEVTRCC